jgi:hypothetical protein
LLTWEVEECAAVDIHRGEKGQSPIGTHSDGKMRVGEHPIFPALYPRGLGGQTYVDFRERDGNGVFSEKILLVAGAAVGEIRPSRDPFLGFAGGNFAHRLAQRRDLGPSQLRQPGFQPQRRDGEVALQIAAGLKKYVRKRNDLAKSFKRDLTTRWEQKARNALKYLVRWEVVNLTQPRKKAFRVKRTYPNILRNRKRRIARRLDPQRRWEKQPGDFLSQAFSRVCLKINKLKQTVSKLYSPK